MEQIEQALLEFTRNLYSMLGWPGVVALMAVESACIPFPSELIMPLAGWMLIKERGLGLSYLLMAGLYGAVGNVLGSLIAYWAGAQGGLPLLRRYGKYLLISRHDLDRAHEWFARYGEWAIFFSRLLPVVRTFISFPAGVARMNLAKFVLYTLLGSFPWSLGLAYGGYILGEHWEEIRAVMRPFDIPVIIVILLLLSLYIWRHWRRAVAEP
ncbi:MAG: DedA family protein [Chloroflexi bacterium]|nr:DedA family protein [Chloroflexota bacterium]